MALTKSEAKLKRDNPEKFRKLQEMRKRRRGKRQLVKPEKAKPIKVTPIGNVKRGSMKPGLDAAAESARKREAERVKKRKAEPPKKYKSNVARGTLKPGLDAAGRSAEKRENILRPESKPKTPHYLPKAGPKVVKPFSAPVKKGKKGTEDPPFGVERQPPHKTNPKGEGSLTGLSMKELISRIEDAEFPTDPDDPSAHDIEDLKADLRELRGRKKGGSVKKKARKKKTAVKKRAALRGFGSALRGF
jgi:hypothetical protein